MLRRKISVFRRKIKPEDGLASEIGYASELGYALELGLASELTHRNLDAFNLRQASHVKHEPDLTL